MNGRIYADEQGLECLFLAISGSSNHLRATSAYPPKADIQTGTSAFALITSALPLKADMAAVGRESPKLTLSGHLRVKFKSRPWWSYPTLNRTGLRCRQPRTASRATPVAKRARVEGSDNGKSRSL